MRLAITSLLASSLALTACDQGGGPTDAGYVAPDWGPTPSCTPVVWVDGGVETIGDSGVIVYGPTCPFGLVPTCGMPNRPPFIDHNCDGTCILYPSEGTYAYCTGMSIQCTADFPVQYCVSNPSSGCATMPGICTSP